MHLCNCMDLCLCLMHVKIRWVCNDCGFEPAKQWRTHTRCVRCLRTPCENFKFWYMKFSNLSLKICVPIIIKSLKSLKRAQLSNARDQLHSKNDYVAANVVRNVVLRYICYK